MKERIVADGRQAYTEKDSVDSLNVHLDSILTTLAIYVYTWRGVTT